MAVRRINPRELNHLKKAIQYTQPVKETLKKSKLTCLTTISEKLHSCTQLLERIEHDLKDDAPLLSNQGGMIKDGVHKELDELRKISFSGKDYLLQIQKRETEKTGISSLKIAYNKVFGYYLEVTNVHKDKVPQEWIRKQTLVNAERYITEELKSYEEKILNAEEKIIQIELKLFNDLVAFAGQFINEIQVNARQLAILDCLSYFAQIAEKNNYINRFNRSGTPFIGTRRKRHWN